MGDWFGFLMRKIWETSTVKGPRQRIVSIKSREGWAQQGRTAEAQLGGLDIDGHGDEVDRRLTTQKGNREVLAHSIQDPAQAREKRFAMEE